MKERHGRSFATAALLFAASAAGAAPPPIPQKDLTFAGGWSFQSRGNNCTATWALDKQNQLILAFTNFEDGKVRLTGKGLPKFAPDSGDEAFAPHRSGTAILIDATPVAAFGYGETMKGVSDYAFDAQQSEVWPKLKAGKMLSVRLIGKQRYVVPLSGSAALWTEMQNCIDQYPNG